MSTPIATEGGHWYAVDGAPKYTIPKKDGSGDRPTTLRDAKKLNLLPSVTTITKVLHSEGLLRFKIQESCMAVLTSPRKEGEDLTAFMERVLYTDREADETAEAARDLGTAVHGAIELALHGKEWNQELAAYVNPTLAEVAKIGTMVAAERVVVGQGYAGKLDLVVSTPHGPCVVDFKTCKKIPKESYDEHRLQLAAYAGACKNIWSTYNIYISTTEPGQVKVVENPYWSDTYTAAWLPLVKFWQWKNNYSPAQ